MLKTVLITGAARGIGAATAKIFASHGYNVVINYKTSKERAEKLKQELEKLYAVEILTIQKDISKEEDVKDMVSTILKKFSRIDCLVNNAAIAKDEYPEGKNKEEFQEVLTTNLVGTYLMCKYVGEEMKKQEYGKIINISSTNAIDSYNTYSMDYDASKAGVISLTHNFAVYLSPFVNVNCIAPGWTNTESVLEMNPNELDSEKEKILLKRFAEPEEIANVIYFLATDEAKYINNEVIRVDGGWHI